MSDEIEIAEMLEVKGSIQLNECLFVHTRGICSILAIALDFFQLNDRVEK